MELRWQTTRVGWRQRLRVPAEYVTWGSDSGCDPTFIPWVMGDVRTPHQVQATSFRIGMTLPDFQPLPPERKTGISESISFSKQFITGKMSASVASLVGLAGDEERRKRIIDAHFRSRYGIFVSSIRRDHDAAHWAVGPKPDKYGLKQLGVIGDIARFKNVLPQPSARDFFYEDGQPITLFFDCTAEEIKDYREDPTWRASGYCQMYFRYPRLDIVVDATFDRFYMPIWPQIKERIETLLDSFAISELNEGQL
jgi:hypothetical protein